MAYKLIIAIVQDKDAKRLSDEFINNDVRATKLSTTGGFLQSGNTTFMIAIEEDRINDVMEIIKKASHAREEFMTQDISMNANMEGMAGYPVKVQVGGATVMVLPIEQFHNF